jgi:hypothetical protein
MYTIKWPELHSQRKNFRAGTFSVLWCQCFNKVRPSTNNDWTRTNNWLKTIRASQIRRKQDLKRPNFTLNDDKCQWTNMKLGQK